MLEHVYTIVRRESSEKLSDGSRSNSGRIDDIYSTRDAWVGIDRDKSNNLFYLQFPLFITYGTLICDRAVNKSGLALKRNQHRFIAA